MSLDNLIKNGEANDLSNDDIRNITNNKCKVISYHDLINVNNIDELFTIDNACIILYEMKQDFGHWTTLIRHNDSQIEFFDPYGFQMDTELKIAIYDNTPFLTNLFNKSNYRLIQNTSQLQTLASEVNTCGRWCALRVVLKNIPLGEFVRYFTTNQHYNNDFWATALTFIYTLK